jgi:molybdopterin adenylyltransferase
VYHSFNQYFLNGMDMNTLRIGLVSISDRASSGVYQDKGIPALEEWLGSALTTPFEIQTRLIPDEQPIIEQTLCELVDEMSCHLVLTTGGTGPARRDVTRMPRWRLPTVKCRASVNRCVR